MMLVKSTFRNTLFIFKLAALLNIAASVAELIRDVISDVRDNKVSLHGLGNAITLQQAIHSQISVMSPIYSGGGGVL